MKRFLLVILFTIFFANSAIWAQDAPINGGVVSSAVPFLTISPDSRAGAMGDVGAATSPDVNSQFWNPAKYSFMKSHSGISLSYTPWLRSLVSDMNIAYLAGYTKLDDIQTISGSIRYFDLGSITFYDEGGAELETQSPNEFSIDMGYARKLSENWSGSVALRYIRSDLFSGTEVNGVPMTAGNSFAADVAFFYTKEFRKARKKSNVSYGINISNIGGKISYDEGQTKDFIPTNFRLGGSYTTEIDAYNKIGFSVDINKLMVPTATNNGNAPANIGNDSIGVIEGMFKSFSDAPGGFNEEMKEIMFSVGVEYWYSDQFALRTGYFNENKDKGDRKYLTFGAGLKMNVFSIDFSYIYTLRRKSPLENTLRFTFGVDIDSFRNQGKRRR